MSMGFRVLKSQPTIYVRGQVYVLCYVDDPLVVGKPPEIDAFFDDMNKHMVLKRQERSMSNLQ